jgi:pimeloyl-ACP methyl ester carboxylesterase
LIQTPVNADATPSSIIEAQLNTIAEDYPKWVAENEDPFFTSDTIPETRTWIKHIMLSVSLPVALACRRTIAEADTRGDLGKITTPTLILHGDADASAPLPITGLKTARLIENSQLIVYPGAPHAADTS